MNKRKFINESRSSHEVINKALQEWMEYEQANIKATCQSKEETVQNVQTAEVDDGSRRSIKCSA